MDIREYYKFLEFINYDLWITDDYMVGYFDDKDYCIDYTPNVYLFNEKIGYAKVIRVKYPHPKNPKKTDIAVILKFDKTKTARLANRTILEHGPGTSPEGKTLIELVTKRNKLEQEAIVRININLFRLDYLQKCRFRGLSNS